MTKTYLETGKGYKLFVDLEKAEVSVEGNFLGEERSIRNQGGELWVETLNYLVSKGNDFYTKTILEDARSGNVTHQDLDGGIVVETGVPSPFK